jgi:hypothetical protein
VDLYQDLLDAYNAREDAREADEWRRKKANHQRHENAAREAHKTRNAARLLIANAQVIDWDGLGIISRNHLVADAENVAANPSISAAELRRLYHARLRAWGDTDNSDLGPDDEMTPSYHSIEEMVLRRLKECLGNPLNVSPPN